MEEVGFVFKRPVRSGDDSVFILIIHDAMEKCALVLVLHVGALYNAGKAYGVYSHAGFKANLLESFSFTLNAVHVRERLGN